MELVVLYFMLILSVYFDFRYRKIPNKITLPCLLFGLSFWTVTNKLDGLAFSLLGLLVGFLVFLIPYIAGGMGAGDVKLMMAVGALIGWKLTVISALYSAIAGGVVAVGFIVFSGSGTETRIRLFEIIVVPILKLCYRLTGLSSFLKWQSRYDKVNMKLTKKYIPYAIPIAIGTILAVSGLLRGIINI